MEEKYKCSVEEHIKTSAVKYCPECRIYMCNKCESYHSPLFKNHHPYNLNKDEDIFTGYCKEKNHPNKLEYYCKSHNELCCANCIVKIQEIGDGQHKDCEICTIKNIKEEKKNKLKDNIKILEGLEIKFNESIKEMKDIIQKVEKNKEDLIVNVQKIFTKIRNTLNDREDELILEINNLYNDKYFNEEIINKSENLPNKLKKSLEKGKSIDKEWDNNNLISCINDCINIENNIKNINIVEEAINKYKANSKIKTIFIPKEDSLNQFLETIKSFGKVIYDNFKFKECPNNIKETRKYSVTGENRNILTKTGTDSCWAGTICENELDKSIEEHKWKIKVLRTSYKYIMVGVAPIDFDIHSSTWNTCGWYYYCYNSTLYSGPPFNFSNKSSGLSSIKDEIVVVMNMKKRTLKFIINNEDKGDSYTNIPIDKPIFPAIFLYNQNDSVEISKIN